MPFTAFFRTLPRLSCLPRLAILLALATVFGAPASAQAQRSWFGGKAKNKWTQDNNWDGSGSVAGADLVFGGTSNLTTDNNFAADTGFGSISFESGAGGFVLNGAAITLNGTVTNSGTNDQTINLGLVLSGTRTFTSTGATPGNVIVSGVMSGAGGIIKEGVNTLVLSGANTFSGDTTLNAGILQIGNATALGASASPLTINGGTLNLANTSISVGNLTGTGGTITSTTAGSRTLSIGSGDTGGGNYQGVIENGTGTTALTKTGTGLITLSGTNTFTGVTTISAGTLQIGNGGTSGSIANTSGVTNNASLVYNRNNDFTAGYVIGGSGTVTKQGAGALSLTGNNTYTGVTTINGGTISATLLANGGSNSSIGASSNAAASLLLGNGGTFRYTGSANVTTDRGFTINGTAAGHGATIESSGTGTLSFDNTVTMAYGTANQTRTLGLGGTNTGSNIFGKVIGNNGSGAVSLTKNGTGLWILNQNNTFTGVTTINGGTLQIGNGAGDGSIFNTSNLVNNGSLVYNRDGGFTVPYVISGSGSVTRAGTGSPLIMTADNTYTGATIISGGSLQLGNGGSTGSLSPSSSITIADAGSTLAFSRNDTVTQGVHFAGVITGDGRVNQRGIDGGSLILNGANTYTEKTRVRSGTLVAGANAPSGAAGAFGNATSAIEVGTGNTVAIDAPTLLIGGTFTVGRDVLVGGFGSTDAYVATLGGGNTSGTSTFSGNVTLSTSAPNYSVVLQAATGGTVDFTGGWTTNNKAITVGSTGNNGTVQLSNTLSTTGAGTVAAGTFQIGNGGTAGWVSGISDITNNASLVFDRSDDVTAPFTISGTGSVTKQGTGMLTLTESNTYAGGTTVNAGTLNVANTSGSATGSGAVVVNTGATLMGSGLIDGTVIVNEGGILSLGASIATLESGSVSLNNTSTFEYEFDSSLSPSVGADLQVANGDLDLFGIVNLDLGDLAVSPTEFDLGTAFTLINYENDWNGGLFTVAGDAIDNGNTFTVGLNTWQLVYDATSGGSNFSSQYTHANFVNIVAVPEPPVLALLAAGGLGLWGIRRRVGKERPPVERFAPPWSLATTPLERFAPATR